MSNPGKRIRSARQTVDRSRPYDLTDAVKLVKSAANAKFDETVDVAMNLGVDPKHADQMVRGVCNLPNGSGRSVRVAVFARGPKAEEAQQAGAEVVFEPTDMDYGSREFGVTDPEGNTWFFGTYRP